MHLIKIFNDYFFEPFSSFSLNLFLYRPLHIYINFQLKNHLHRPTNTVYNEASCNKNIPTINCAVLFASQEDRYKQTYVYLI